MLMGNVDLYYRPDTEECMNILKFLNDNQIQINRRSVYDLGFCEDLVVITKQVEVPCLVIANSEVHIGYDEVLAWLQAKLDEAKAEEAAE